MSVRQFMAFCVGSPAAVPFIKNGELVALGVTGPKRSTSMPSVPTIAESGLPGYDVTSWNALFAPAGTPAAIVKRISAVVGKGLNQPDALEVFDAQGLDQATSTPDELAAMVKTELAKWAKVIKAAGIRAE